MGYVASVSIDLNADLGAGCSESNEDLDRLFLALATSANIACGAHAGDPATILNACGEASASGVAIGALIGYRDPFGGGRRFIDYDADDLTAEIIYQLGALDGLALTEGTRVSHLRPAGALMVAVETDRHHAWAIVNAVLDYDPSLVVVGAPNSALVTTAERHGVPTALEFQPHRMPRTSTEAGRLIADPHLVTRRAIDAAESGRYATLRLPRVSPAGIDLARAVVTGLVHAGHRPQAFVAQETPATARAGIDSG